MSSPPPTKRPRTSPSTTEAGVTSAKEVPSQLPPPPPQSAIDQGSLAPPESPNSRKRARSPGLDTRPPPLPPTTPAQSTSAAPIAPLLSEDTGKRRGRTNTPWSAQEEQRLKQMRDAGKSWGEIAKSFPTRTEGSVKKHWYKDMHYAEFSEEEVTTLRDAIREYDANKWKAIAAKIGKPAKACEQYAREHFKNM